MGVTPPTHPRLDGVPPHAELDGIPPPIQDWMGYPSPRLEGVPPPTPTRRQISKESTCYAPGDMPLAFTQEDFLVGENYWMDIYNFMRNLEKTSYRRPLFSETLEISYFETKILPSSLFTCHLFPFLCVFTVISLKNFSYHKYS